MLVPVTFDPSGVVAWVPTGTTLLDASLGAGVPIHAQCGGRGTCGTCAVRVIEGELSDPDPDEQVALVRAPRDVRLGCRARAVGPVRVAPLTPAAVVSHEDGGREAGAGDRLVAAVDLGTTTVAAVVLGCESGVEVGRAIVPNRQQAYGADVLSRLARAQAGAGPELAKAARESVRQALELAAGTRGGEVVSVVIASNTAMSALLAGADISRLAVAPFEAPELPSFPPDDLIPGAPFAVQVLRPIASFVGGDTRAGLIATGITRSEAPQMLLDVGTNAEVALACGGNLYVTSAAAGPAFEGAGLGCGGPAVEGAGVRVALDGDGDVEILGMGDAPVRWLSGSGVVSAIALLVRTGHLDESGRLSQDGPLRARFSLVEDVVSVDLGTPAHPVSLTQLDVRAFQLAKAAVRVAVEKVMDAAGVLGSELDALHVAGAFGGSLEPEDMALLGLIPGECVSAVRQAGNASLAGAAAVACGAPAESGSVEAAASTAVHVSLAEDPGFSAALMNAVGFASHEG